VPWDIATWNGGEQTRCGKAASRLLLIIPLTLALIAFLVTRRWAASRDMLLWFCSPFPGLQRGSSRLFITGTHLSISAAMGFISIFGIAVQEPSSWSPRAEDVKEGHPLEEGRAPRPRSAGCGRR